MYVDFAGVVLLMLILCLGIFFFFLLSIKLELNYATFNSVIS